MGILLERHSLVAEAQRLLNELGYNAGTVDGKAGSRTAAAVKAFQGDRGLSQDGSVSPELVAQLRRAIIEKISSNNRTPVVSTEQIENAYIDYVHAMVKAINYGDFDQVSSFLSEGSPLWRSQITLVKNLFEKKIKENVVEAHVVEIHWASDSEMELRTKETITVRYPSGKANTKAYYWIYKATCFNANILFFDIEKWLE